MNVKKDPVAVRTRTTKAEQSEATRAALLGAARPLFAERGYAAVATEEIVRAAGVTRGALYHHFAGKEELFAAVYEEVEADLVAEIGQVATVATAPLAALLKGAARVLEACRRPEVQRITLIDAPSVLGWERWREIGVRYGFGLIEEVLRAGMEQGVIEPPPLRRAAVARPAAPPAGRDVYRPLPRLAGPPPGMIRQPGCVGVGGRLVMHDQHSRGGGGAAPEGDPP